MYNNFIKRILDIIISFTALVILSPLFLVVAVLVRKKLGSPAVFKQKRPGLKGEIFTMYKFRSMTTETDESGNPLPDELRLTKFGEMLRATSLDELPELWNILKGEMSLVGPRPLLVKYLPLYSQQQKRRHDVKPGLTGWAQVNGRNSISWSDKFNLDIWYVDNCSFLLDLKILYMTVKKVISGEDINQEGQATAEDFKGDN